MILTDSSAENQIKLRKYETNYVHDGMRSKDPSFNDKLR